MSETAIIINVNKKDFVYRRGPLGTYVVPGKGDGKFGILIVRPMGEVQDIGGNQVRRGEAVHPSKLCKDILGEKGLKLGLFVCSAEPDEPRSLLKAEAVERDYLEEHPGKVEQTKNQRLKMMLSETVRSQREIEQMEKNALKVSEENTEFHDHCKKQVKPAEVAKAVENLTAYYQSLCSEGDTLWAVENTRREIGLHHQDAAREMGYEPPWASTPSMKMDCPACGAKIKPDVAICLRCEAVVNDAKARQFKVGPYKVSAQPVGA